ncbi:transposase [candidate division WOR-3 bacterium]|nr:transposase [candidate division WOR-3 bacterium]
MARALRIQFSGAFYHVTCRGIERRQIFMDDTDRNEFIELFSGSIETYQVVVFAYTLMANHFHLLIQTKKANCSEFMRHFNICYTGWFNYRHHRSGNLYQGRYHAFLVDADNYLLEVSRYLHLNIVRQQNARSLVQRARWEKARDYPWSSLAGYANERHAVPFVNYDLILCMVGGRRAYRAFVIDGIKKNIEDPFKRVRSRVILGSDEFITQAKQYLRRVSRREQPAYQDLMTPVLEPEQLLGILSRECGINIDSLRQRRTAGELRGIAADLLYKYCDITQTQIGRLLGNIDYVSVHQLRRRLKKKMAEDVGLREHYRRIEAKIKAACIM